MQLSSVSKHPTISYLQQKINIFDQLPHNHCQCVHCVNNTKPLVKQKAPRITSHKQIQLQDSEAYTQMIQKMAEYQFLGKMKIPDIFVTQQSSLIYTSKSNNKIKRKENQNNLDIKRYFDEHRKKFQHSIDAYNLSKLTLNSNNPQQKSIKQIALLVYKDGTQQLLTENYLTKTLQKRKNDSFWSQVSHIMHIPPEINYSVKKYSFHFERTSDSIVEMTPFLQKIAQDLDNIQEKLYMNVQAEKQDKFLSINMQMSQMNPQFKVDKRYTMSLSKYDSLLFNSIIHKNEQQIQQDLKISVYQLVSFLQISNFIRVLNGIFEFFIDERGTIYFSKIRKCILDFLEPHQRNLIHDRYKPLDQIQLEEISHKKQEFDKIQEQNLWKTCTSIMNDCLQTRKVQLKLKDYKKPNKETLLKIFMRIFPQFKPKDVFENKNWKNDLEIFMKNIRQKINAIIRQDEGIRILRRFNIQFRRTFK